MIRFDCLRAGYGGDERLHGVSCALAEGKLTALAGPNGSGKSTLLKCAAGVMKPASGTIYLGDQPYSAFDRRGLARRVAYMPQTRPVPEMTVFQLAAQGRYPHQKRGQALTSADREIVEQSLLRAGAMEFAARSVTHLSGGERQRAYLAMMLAQQTDVLLLDEPAAFLDPGGQFALTDLLLSLRSEGRTVAVVMHDLPLALECADRVLVMHSGQLAAHGAPQEVHASGVLDAVFGVGLERIAGRYVFSRTNH